MVDILLDKDLKCSLALLLVYDFVPSTIDDMDCVKWIVTLTAIIKVACVWEQVACK